MYTIFLTSDVEIRRQPIEILAYVKHSYEADTPVRFIDCSSLSHSKTVIVSIYQSTCVPEANFVNELHAVHNNVNTSHLIGEWRSGNPLNCFWDSYELDMLKQIGASATCSLLQ
jgi:hypothetical protein